MSVESAIFETLLNEPTLVALRSTRVSFWRADHVTPDTLPYQTLQLIDDSDLSEHQRGQSGLRQARVQINSFADAAPDAKALDDATRRALVPLLGRLGTGTNRVALRRIYDDGTRSEWEDGRTSSGFGVYAYRSDYLVSYKDDAIALSIAT